MELPTKRRVEMEKGEKLAGNLIWMSVAWRYGERLSKGLKKKSQGATDKEKYFMHIYLPGSVFFLVVVVVVVVVVVLVLLFPLVNTWQLERTKQASTLCLWLIIDHHCGLILARGVS